MVRVIEKGGCRGATLEEEKDTQGAGTGWRNGILGDFWRSWSATSSPLPPFTPNHNKAVSLIEINKLILLQFAHTCTHEQLKYKCVKGHMHAHTHTHRRGMIHRSARR